MKYRVEIAEWKDGSGFMYNSEIDSFDEYTTARNYVEICADGPEGILKPISGDDLEVRIIDNETNKTISAVWVSVIYEKLYGENWEEILQKEGENLERLNLNYLLLFLDDNTKISVCDAETKQEMFSGYACQFRSVFHTEEVESIRATFIDEITIFVK